MTIQEVPRQEVPSSAELSDIPVSYDVYRSVCDARANNFRLTGIVSEEGYESALQDPLTQYVSIAGVRYPYLTPMRHVEGYDEEKTARLTGKPKVFVLALPPRMLAEEGVDGAQFPALADDEVVLVESGWQDYQNDMQVAPQLFGGQAVEILDTRLEGSEDQPAAMSLYTGRFIQTDPTVSTEAPKTFGEVFDQNRGDNEYILGQNGSRVVLYEGKDLTQNSEVLEQIWAICEDRFDEMGEMHPVSMEESKEFFVQMLKNESVGAIVAFEDNQVVSFGFSMQDFAECEWMTPQTRRQLMDTSVACDDHQLYFAEIFSKRNSNANYALDVIGLYCDLIAGSGRGVRLAFESSNMAATYIPALVEAYVNSTGSLKVDGDMNLLDKLYYWAITR